MLPDLDPNQDKQSQSLSYYRYTIRQFEFKELISFILVCKDNLDIDCGNFYPAIKYMIDFQLFTLIFLDRLQTLKLGYQSMNKHIRFSDDGAFGGDNRNKTCANRPSDSYIRNTRNNQIFY